ncbi:MAG TPA: iron-containing redox enzyme family protein [Cellvibrio sp.]|nr:iron-containing redox enzyme family protein [Cellvibrio sp.]
MSSLTSIEKDPFAFHSRLAKFNVNRLAVRAPTTSWEEDERDELKFRLLEGKFLEELRTSIKPLTRRSTNDADQFVAWFESLAEWGPGQHHPLFDWLANDATEDQMKWFLTQEAAGEAGFEDLVAYTQVKLPVQAKLECARNYWDEMGRGKPKAMHGPLLENMVRELNLKPSIETTVWESLALGNTMLGLATSRRYTYHSLGALGAIELTAPLRAARVARGMNRLGFSRKARAYFDLHAVLDISHSREWNKEIIRPLVAAQPECAQFLAEGALMRLQCGKLCFDRYSRDLKLNSCGIEHEQQRNTVQKVANC